MGSTTETLKLKSRDDSKAGFNSVKRNISSLDRLAAKASKGVAGIAGGAALASLGALTKKSIDAADAIEKLSRRSGGSAKFLSEMRFSLSQNDVSLEEFNKSLTKINKSSQDAIDGLSTQTRAFDKLGISVDEFAKLDTEQKFVALSQAISEVEDPAVKTQLAMDIMGRSGVQLLTVMEDGAEGIARYRQEAEKMGLSLSQDQVQGAAAANDAIDRLTSTISGKFSQAVLENSGYIEETANWLADRVPAAIDATMTAFDLLGDVIGVAFDFARSLTQFFYDNFLNVRLLVDGVGASFQVWKAVFTDTELFGIAMIETIMVGLERVKGFAAKAAAGFKLAFVGAFDIVLETFATLIENIGKGAELIGADDLASSVRGFGSEVRNVLTPLDDFEQRLIEIDKETEESIDSIKMITGAMADEAIAAKLAAEELDKTSESTGAFDLSTIKASESSAQLKKNLVEQKKAAAELKKEQDRLAKAAGQDLLKSQKDLNRILDEAEQFQKNYNVALGNAVEVIKSRGLIEGTKEYEKALEDLGFKTAEVKDKTEDAVPTIAALWENTVGSVQSTLQGLFRNGLDGFDNWFDAVLDSLKDFIAAFLAQWAASGILGLLNGDGFSGFSLDNAFGDGSKGSGLGGIAGIFGSRQAQETAGQVLGQQAGQTFNNVVTGAGGAFNVVGGLGQINAGLDQGGTAGAVNVVSGIASVVSGVKTVSGLLAGGSAAASAGAAAAATAGTAAASAGAATAAAAAAGTGAAAAAASAATAAGAATAAAGAGTAAASAAAGTAAAASGSAATAATAAAGAGSSAGAALAAAAPYIAAVVAVVALLSGNSRSFGEIVQQDYLPDLLGQNVPNEAIGADGVSTGFNGGNTAIFGANFGIQGTGLTAQLLADGGANGNGGFFTGAQKNLEEFAELLKQNGIEAKISGGVLRALSRDNSKTAEDIKNIWQEYANGITEAVAFTEVYKTAIENNLIKTDNLFFENFALGFAQNAFEARDSLLMIDKSFDELVANGTEKTEALTKAFSEFYGLTEQETQDFFNKAGISIDKMADQFIEASGESLAALLDFNADGVTSFETLVKGAEIAAGGVAGHFSGALNGVDLGTPRPIRIPQINIPAQAQAASDPFLGSFNKGGRFIVPGTGNFDKPFRINLTPGEEVTVKPKDRSGEGVKVFDTEANVIDAIYDLIDTLHEMKSDEKRMKAKADAT